MFIEFFVIYLKKVFLRLNVFILRCVLYINEYGNDGKEIWYFWRIDVWFFGRKIVGGWRMEVILFFVVGYFLLVEI